MSQDFELLVSLDPPWVPVATQTRLHIQAHVKGNFYFLTQDIGFKDYGPPTRSLTLKQLVHIEFVNDETGDVFREKGTLTSDDVVTCMAPALSVAGSYSITMHCKPPKSAPKDVEVFVGMDPLRAPFVVYEQPLLTSIEPRCGPAYGGTSTIIHGLRLPELADELAEADSAGLLAVRFYSRCVRAHARHAHT